MGKLEGCCVAMMWMTLLKTLKQAVMGACGGHYVFTWAGRYWFGITSSTSMGILFFSKACIKMHCLYLVILNNFMYNTTPHYYPVNLQYSRCKHVFSISVENSKDPDQMATSKVSWSGATLCSKQDISRLSRTMVNFWFPANPTCYFIINLDIPMVNNRIECASILVKIRIVCVSHLIYIRIKLMSCLVNDRIKCASYLVKNRIECVCPIWSIKELSV